MAMYAIWYFGTPSVTFLYLYRGLPNPSLYHRTMLTRSLGDDGVMLQGKLVSIPATDWILVTGTAKATIVCPIKHDPHKKMLPIRKDCLTVQIPNCADFTQTLRDRGGVNIVDSQERYFLYFSKSCVSHERWPSQFYSRLYKKDRSYRESCYVRWVELNGFLTDWVRDSAELWCWLLSMKKSSGADFFEPRQKWPFQ